MNDWEAEFKRRMVTFLLSNGSPVRMPDEDTTYGWLARDYRSIYSHLESCAPDMAKCSWDDSEWNEFAGTFAEPQVESRNGMGLKLTCMCGRPKNCKVR